ncbi:hypothetical protein LR48_Vigan08g060800 [Vigna angularis]|uniref:Uncharacterized protein n=1 Tax=Phaseolus angularis TaxID=3914 RepID=A0A0L9V460_PHAAN|nr:hypothetical protein LR48_Vigan08g060800 [Vigna angularis]
MGFGKCFADPCIGSPLQRLLGASNDSVAASNDCTDASRCCSLSPSTAASNDVASSFAASNHFRWCLHLIALRVVHLAASNDASALSIAAPTAASNDHGAFIFVAVRVVYLAASNDVSALLLPPPLPPFAAALFLSFPLYSTFYFHLPGGDYPYYPPPGPSSSPPHPPPTPSSPPRVFTWDFLSIFNSFENGYPIYPPRFGLRVSSPKLLDGEIPRLMKPGCVEIRI